jgi:hypothetical protein
MVEEHLLDKAVRTLDPSVIHDHRSVSMHSEKRACRTGPTAEATTAQTQMTAPLPAASIITKLVHPVSLSVSCNHFYAAGASMGVACGLPAASHSSLWQSRFANVLLIAAFALLTHIAVPQTNLARSMLLRRWPVASTRRGRCVSLTEKHPAQFASLLCSQGNPRALQRPWRTLRCLLSDTGLQFLMPKC